jgi:hypothetical protein
VFIHSFSKYLTYIECPLGAKHCLVSWESNSENCRQRAPPLPSFPPVGESKQLNNTLFKYFEFCEEKQSGEEDRKQWRRGDTNFKTVASVVHLSR